jgi:hypothetical protein
MPVQYEEIKENPGRLERDSACYTHPSFAQISASNVSGGTYLYGSDFHHQHYVTIRIKRSEMNRNLSNDWPHAREELIEVALSESQWATFVSSMNRGEGVQCTIQHYEGKMVPQIPRIKSRIGQFQAEGEASAEEAVNAITELRDEINSSKLSQKQKDAWIRKLDFIEGRTTGNLRFVASQFVEHMEGVVQKAKTEISAFAQNLIMRTGLSKLMGPEDAKKMLGYEERSDK